MIKWNRLVLILISALFIFSIQPLPAAEIAIIKSSNIAPYNQAVTGFMQEIKATAKVYDLGGRSDIVSEIMGKITKEQPKLIFALGALAAVRTKENITHIPIIYTQVLHPEDKSLTGENVTGVGIEVAPKKQFSALISILPEVKSIGVLYSRLSNRTIASARESCRNMGLKFLAVKLEHPGQLPDELNKLSKDADVLWLVPDSLVINKNSLRYMLLFTLENRISFMVYNKGFVKAGALFSFSANNINLGRQAGRIAQKVMQGEAITPGVVPPLNTELAINLNTARRLEIQIPQRIIEKAVHIYE